tara:strand:+ start:1760 stop:1969 length:210 start_codon:yes stop_codon:yes gene_type:complete
MRTEELTKQQIENNLAAAAQEVVNIKELELTLAKITDKSVKQGVKHRIKICKQFHRSYLLNAQSLQQML